MTRLPAFNFYKIFVLTILLSVMQGCVAVNRPAEHTITTTPDPAVTHANQIGRDEVVYKEGYYGTGDARLHYVEAGEGPLIIFYHGFPSFWYSWFDQMEALKGRYRVVAVDGLGAGLSAKPLSKDAYRIEKLAAQIDGLAVHLAGRERFILIGHDWGAALAFAYAQNHPHRLNAVIGLSAPPFNLFLDLVRTNPQQQKRSQYMPLFNSLTLADLMKPGVTERLWNQSYGQLIADGDLTAAEGELFRQKLADPQAIHGGMHWYRANVPAFASITEANHWPARHSKIDVPTMLIWGNDDQAFVDDFLPEMKTYARRMKIARLSGVSHWTSMENPQLATREIEEFLRDQTNR